VTDFFLQKRGSFSVEDIKMGAFGVEAKKCGLLKKWWVIFTKKGHLSKNGVIE
jgi:hypothetical protein